VSDRLAAVYAEEWPRCVAILTRVLGDLERAEDAVQDAFATALERWPRDGIPDNPGAWIVTAARNRAIDRIRRERVLADKTALLARLESLPVDPDEMSALPDERLALRVHLLPSRSRDVQIRSRSARSAVGYQRSRPRSRAGANDGAAARACQGRSSSGDRSRPHPDAPDRLAAACAVSSSAGYAASGARRSPPRSPEARLRSWCTDAGQPRAFGLLALMLCRTRADARLATVLVLLADQDRQLWDAREIDEGLRMLERAEAFHGPGLPAPGGDRAGMPRIRTGDRRRGVRGLLRRRHAGRRLNTRPSPGARR
jgi:RNA polymerase sigma-70 factor (ECF subfamily)